MFDRADQSLLSGFPAVNLTLNDALVCNVHPMVSAVHCAKVYFLVFAVVGLNIAVLLRGAVAARASSVQRRLGRRPAHTDNLLQSLRCAISKLQCKSPNSN